MKKILYLTVGVSILGAGIANAQFADHRPPPVINFSKSPRTMAEEALNEARRNGTLKREETIVEDNNPYKLKEVKEYEEFRVDEEFTPEDNFKPGEIPLTEEEGPQNLIVYEQETKDEEIVIIDKRDEIPTQTQEELIENPSQHEYEQVIKIPAKRIDLYDFIDSDKDGFVSPEEYNDFAAKRTAKIYQEMDTDGNGIISREEFNYYRRKTLGRE